MPNELKWRSSIAELIQELIATKRASGFKYKYEEQILSQFDAYYYREGYTGIRLTQEMVNGYIYEPGLRPGTYRKREKTLNELGTYANDRGYAVFIAPVITTPSPSRHIPYILSDGELVRLFAAIDAQQLSSFTNAALVDPALFRVLYSTGLRLSEALGLSIEDVDLEKELLFVRNAKGGGERQVPFKASLSRRLKDYLHAMHTNSSGDDRFFPGQKPKASIDQSTINRRFRYYLLEADIPHSFRSPCAHSFRHGFAVGCLRKWVREGRDLTTCMPYLTAYMGHADLRATQYYLRLTADLYPEIIETVEAQFGYVIPEGGGHGAL